MFNFQLPHAGSVDLDLARINTSEKNAISESRVWHQKVQSIMLIIVKGIG
jgi:hypothetical protein